MRRSFPKLFLSLAKFLMRRMFHSDINVIVAKHATYFTIYIFPWWSLRNAVIVACCTCALIRKGEPLLRINVQRPLETMTGKKRLDERERTSLTYFSSSAELSSSAAFELWPSTIDRKIMLVWILSYPRHQVQVG